MPVRSPLRSVALRAQGIGPRGWKGDVGRGSGPTHWTPCRLSPRGPPSLSRSTAFRRRSSARTTGPSRFGAEFHVSSLSIDQIASRAGRVSSTGPISPTNRPVSAGGGWRRKMAGGVTGRNGGHSHPSAADGVLRLRVDVVVFPSVSSGSRRKFSDFSMIDSTPRRSMCCSGARFRGFSSISRAVE